MALLVVIVAVGGVAYYELTKLGKSDAGKQEPVAVTIPQGMTATQIGNLLEEKKVVNSALMFKLYIKRENLDVMFKPGEYEMKTNMEFAEVSKILTDGPPITYVDITIPEGWTAKQIAERISANTGINAAEYLQMVGTGQTTTEYPFIKTSGAQNPNLEGYLYPQTYRLEKDVNAADFLNMQLAEFQEMTGSLLWTNAQAMGRTPYEIIVIASLIERETLVKDERPMVASVIYNRLKINMPLQIDATVQYALPEWKDRLTLEDLKIDSPYNTYKITGLPPGPICNPSLSSIEAALEPAISENLYYVLAADNSGRHVFAKTYNEFLQAKQQYQASQR